ITDADGGPGVGFVGADGLEVWDPWTDHRLFEETRRVMPGQNESQASAVTQSYLSPDGRRLAWSHRETVFVRELASGQEVTVSLDGPLLGGRLSNEPCRLLTATHRGLSLWDWARGRGLWARRNGWPG